MIRGAQKKHGYLKGTGTQYKLEKRGELREITAKRGDQRHKGHCIRLLRKKRHDQDCEDIKIQH